MKSKQTKTFLFGARITEGILWNRSLKMVTGMEKGK